MAVQKERIAEISTPLGTDVLALRTMTGTEALGRLFAYDLDLLSSDESIPIDDILGQNVTIRIDLEGDEVRYINGFVSRFVQSGRSTGYATYQATVRPWLWLLTRRTDCRIFQAMTVPDIVQKVFRDLGFTEFEASLKGTHPTWDYCVQYRETDFNFVSRLMEQEGIYYFFKHENGKHTMVLADEYGAHAPIPNHEKISYYPPTENVVREEEHIWSWTLSREVVPGRYALDDYDFEKPSAEIAAEAKVDRKNAMAGFEVYDYPGEYLTAEEGGVYAKWRIEELQAQYEQVQGVSDVRGLTNGGLFSLDLHPRSDQNREYLVTGTSLTLRNPEFETGEEDTGKLFTCSFTAIESKTPFRTQRLTPKPFVQGPQTAVVVGPAGDEIYTDKYGRVKVQFHWDRYGKKDENSSCWIRVAQLWAGKSWGGMHVPRIGQEVIVDFLEGDPDCPIVTGRVYNDELKVPFPLPDKAMVSGIKSNSTPGGGGHNEISFDDTKGTEKLTIHGQYDMATTVLHDQTASVGNNRSGSVTVDDTESIGVNQTLTVGSNQTETIGADRTTTIGANDTLTVGANQTVTVGSNQNVTVGSAASLTVGSVYAVNVAAAMNQAIGGALATEVGGALVVEVGAISSEEVGANKSISAGINFSLDAGSKVNLEAGSDFNADAGANVTIKAGGKLTLKAGGASITLSGGNVMIKGGKIVLKGSNVEIKGSGGVKIKGATITEN